MPGCPLSARNDPVGRAQERREAEIDEIDARETEHELAGDQDALGEQVVDEVQERDVGVGEDLGRVAP